MDTMVGDGHHARDRLPFDPDGIVSVELTEAEWQATNAASPPRNPAYGRQGVGLD